MRHPVHRMACAVTLALIVILQPGCATTSTQPETPASPATGTSAPPEAVTDEAAPAAYPPPPGDVSGLRGWFEEAYPEAPWLSRIKDIEYVEGEVPGSGGFANAVVMTTDLDFKTEQATAQEIATALGEAQPGWAKQYVVWFADGANLQAGEIIDPTP